MAAFSLWISSSEREIFIFLEASMVTYHFFPLFQLNSSSAGFGAKIVTENDEQNSFIDIHCLLEQPRYYAKTVRRLLNCLLSAIEKQ